MSTITRGGTSITPTLILGWDSGRRSSNIEHTIIGRAVPDVSLGPARPRAGTMSLLFTSYEAALAAEELHALPGRFVLVVDSPAITMQYVLAPGAELRLVNTPETSITDWMLEVPFLEVPS